MPPLLTYALLAGCAAVFALGLWASRARDASSSRWAKLARWSLVLQIGAAVGAYLVLRPGRGIDGTAAIHAASADGRPIFIDMYSNF